MSMHGRFLIIAGSRNIDNIGEVFRALNRSPYSLPKKIISGGARGVDQLAIDVAELEGIPHEVFKADWDQYGKSAGPIRNKQMAEYAANSGIGALLLIWDGKSRGSKNMLDEAFAQGLPIYVHMVAKNL